jgi:hypothetical protein
MAARVDTPFYRNSAWFFLVFLAFAVWAFWPSYFARLFQQPSFQFHAHGIALTLWCVMLVVQPQLLRTGRRRLHRTLGKASYVLAPCCGRGAADCIERSAKRLTCWPPHWC